MILKSISIKVQGCKSGRCAVKAVVLPPGGLGRVPESGLRGAGFKSVPAPPFLPAKYPPAGANCFICPKISLTILGENAIG
jgi:hypothetical protein